MLLLLLLLVVLVDVVVSSSATSIFFFFFQLETFVLQKSSLCVVQTKRANGAFGDVDATRVVVYVVVRGASVGET